MPRSKLKLQQNGMIVIETHGENFVRTSVAHDVSFMLEYKTCAGTWEKISGSYSDEITARQILRECNPRIQYRLVALHADCIGQVALPKSWQGWSGQ